MKSLRFALCGITLLCLLFSCSELEEMPETNQEAGYESVTDKDNDPLVNGKDGDVSDLEDPDNDASEEEDDFTDEKEPELPPIYKDPNAPVLQINELRTEYNGTQLRSEFIEFRANANVNLGGMRVFIASNNKNPLVYEFLPVEIKEDEYVVLHLRTLEDTCKNEYGENLNESGGRDASATARDFWVPGNTKLLRKTDIVYVLDQDDNVIDAVMLSETPDAHWSKDYFTEAAEFLFNHGAWMSANGTVGSPEDAVNTSDIKTSYTKSISRDEMAPFTRTAADWFVTASGGATPGERNNVR